MTSKSGNYRIVVVGSDQFDDKAFIFGILDQFKALWEDGGTVIDKVYSGSFTGVSKFTKEWAELQGVNYVEHHFFSDKKDNPIFERLDIPDFIISQDEYYQKGKEFFQEQQIDILITMPNKEGELGVHTQNILRMAKAAGMTDRSILGAEALYKISKEISAMRMSETKEKAQQVTKLSSIDKF